jgi:hypothetical protein
MKKSKRISARQKAARRTAAGKFTKEVFNKIGGKECPRYTALTWKERDKVQDKFPAVKARYERHMASVR